MLDPGFLCAGTIMSDPFEDALEDLRISGSVLLHETYARPWSISVPGEMELRAMLDLGRDARVIPFHLVRHHGFDVAFGPEAPTRINEPEVLICPSGAPHRMFDGSATYSVPFAEILAGRGPAPARASDPVATELLCGVFVLRATPLNPLLAALPPIMTVSTSAAEGGPMLAGAAALLEASLARGARHSFIASRLLEVFCAEAISVYRRTHGTDRPSWLRALSDPPVAAAIRFVHARPAEMWTVGRLGAAVGLSVSRFGARFRSVMGESVMAYVFRWRANVACRLLAGTDLPMAEVGLAVGYESLPAFGRAFRAQVGQSPGAWRRAAKSRPGKAVPSTTNLPMAHGTATPR